MKRRPKASATIASIGLAAAAGLAGTGTGATAQAAPAGPAQQCQPQVPGGPLFITTTCTDPVLDQPYIDSQSTGTTTDPATGVTVHYTYVHGGFTGTNARFAFYFPAKNAYKGRFFESTYPTITTEDATPDVIAFAISNGAYVVSDNNNGGVGGAGNLGAYRVNAAAAKYSRVVAKDLYKTTARPRGYIHGASGGAYQTLGAMENTDGVWDGGVPMVPGVPNAIPSFMTAELLALRVLGGKMPQIVAATSPGGSGDPYAGLTAEQTSVLHEVTSLGFPLRGWWQYATLNGGAFAAVEGGVRAIDPTYITDFWTQPGYEGTQPSVQAARIQYDTTVTGIVGSPATGITVAGVPGGELANADLVVTSGAAAGQTLMIQAVSGDTITVGSSAAASLLRPGDSVRLDNSWLIALEYYQRHQVPTPDEYGWNQYRTASGTPAEPQRPILVGPILAAGAGGAVATGHFHGKMIMLASVMDVQAFSWSADWYRTQAEAAFGSSLNASYRLWYMDNADHDPPGPAATPDPAGPDHIVSYTGELQQALLELDAWVGHGIQPPATSGYHITADDQVQLAGTAGQRHGVQPVVTLTAHARGAQSADGSVTVRTGEAVTFTVRATDPQGAGKITRIEWDYTGAGSFPVSQQPSGIATAISANGTYTFTKPGTYYVYVRVTSQHDGNPNAPYGQVQNLAGIRVIVQ
jgi:hypothetical protein